MSTYVDVDDMASVWSRVAGMDPDIANELGRDPHRIRLQQSEATPLPIPGFEPVVVPVETPTAFGPPPVSDASDTANDSAEEAAAQANDGDPDAGDVFGDVTNESRMSLSVEAFAVGGELDQLIEEAREEVEAAAAAAANATQSDAHDAEIEVAPRAHADEPRVVAEVEPRVVAEVEPRVLAEEPRVVAEEPRVNTVEEGKHVSAPNKSKGVVAVVVGSAVLAVILAVVSQVSDALLPWATAALGIIAFFAGATVGTFGMTRVRAIVAGALAGIASGVAGSLVELMARGSDNIPMEGVVGVVAVAALLAVLGAFVSDGLARLRA